MIKSVEYPSNLYCAFLSELNINPSSVIEYWFDQNATSLYKKEISFDYQDGEEGDTWKYEYYLDENCSILAATETNFGGDIVDYYFTQSFIDFMKPVVDRLIEYLFLRMKPSL